MKTTVPKGAKVGFDDLVQLLGDVKALEVKKAVIKDDDETPGEFAPKTDWDAIEADIAEGVVAKGLDRAGRVIHAKNIDDQRKEKASSGGGGKSAIYAYDEATGLVKKITRIQTGTAYKKD